MKEAKEYAKGLNMAYRIFVDGIEGKRGWQSSQRSHKINTITTKQFSKIAV